MELSLPLDIRQQVSVTEVTQDGYFYVQIDSPDTRNLEKLSSDIYDVVCATPTATKGFRPSAGATCFAQSLLDDRWYRAVILTADTTSQQYSVYYVDYGNSEESLTIDRLFPLVADFFKTPYQAIKCRLASFTPISGDSWSEECYHGLTENILNQTIPCTFHSKVASSSKLESYYFVTLYWDDSSDEEYTVQDELVAMGLGTYQPISVPGSIPATGPSNTSDVTTPYPLIGLAVGEKYSVYVSYSLTPDIVWAQLSANTDVFQDLVIRLQDSIEGSQPLPIISHASKDPPPINKPCCIQYAADNTWCRGLIESIDIPSRTANVLFVDFGNTEVIPLSDIFVLPPEFINTPAQAVSFSIHGLVAKEGVWSTESLSRFKELYDNQELMCEVVCIGGDGYPSVILNNVELGCDIAQVLIDEGHAFKASVEVKLNKDTVGAGKVGDNATPSSKSASNYSDLSLPVGVRFEGSVSHVDSLRSFYVQQCKQAEQLGVLTEQISLHCESSNARPVDCVKPGMPVLAQYEDGQWYRARITPPDDELNDWGVVFIDYGNKQKIPLSKLLDLPPALLEFPVQAFHCCLRKCPDLKVENKSAVDLFKTLTLDQPIECLVSKKSTDEDGRDLYTVSIFTDGTDVLERIQQVKDTPSTGDNKGEKQPSYLPLTTPCNEKILVKICYIESVQVFACQLVDNHVAIEELQVKLNSEYQSRRDHIVKPVIGTPCVALFSLDNQWYRALVKKVHSADGLVEVLFVDYGNTESVPFTDTRSITQEYLELPCQSVLCSLDGVPPTLVTELSAPFAEMYLESTMEAEFFKSTVGVGEVVPCKLFTPETNSLVSKELRDKMAPPIKLITDSPFQPTSDHTHLSPSSAGNRSGSRSRQSSENSLIPAVCVMVPTQLDAVVSYIVDPSEFYIQQSSNSGKIASLLEDMYEYYHTKKKGFPLQSPYVGIHCSAPYSDGNFYRARMCSIDSNNCQVFYLDYGNTENVLLGDLYTLSTRFTSLPTQAIKCCLSGATVATNGATPYFNWSDECIQVMKDTILEQSVMVDVTRLQSEDYYEVKVFVQSQDLGGMLVEAGLLKTPSRCSSRSPRAQSTTVSTRTTSVSSTPPPSGQATPTVSQLTLSIGTTVEAIVTAITTKLYIYCQLVSNNDVINKIANTILKFVASNPTPLASSQVKKGMYVLSKFTDDNQWYRGKILSVDKGIKVGYIDYGNFEVVPLDRLCELPVVLYGLPSQAIRCQLSGLEDCTVTNKASVEERLLYNQCSVKLLKKESGQRYIVDMTMSEDGSSVKDWIVQSKLLSNYEDRSVPNKAVSTVNTIPDISISKPAIDDKGRTNVKIPSAISSIPSDQTSFSGYLSHIESIDRFYCQPVNTAEEFESMNANLLAYYENQVKPKNSPPVLTDKGAFVAALYSADSSWYRAEIMEVVGEGAVKVMFVDFGNTETVLTSNIRRLEDQFTGLSCQGVPCNLTGVVPVNGGCWKPSDIDSFSGLITVGRALNLELSKIGQSCLEVAEMKTEEGVNVGAELVKCGIARQRPPSLHVSPERSPARGGLRSPSHASPKSKKRVNSGDSNSSRASNTNASSSPSRNQQLVPYNINEDDILSVYISHRSNEAVWVQLVAQELELQALSESINEVYNPSSVGRLVLSNVKPGQLCCAQFNEDNRWYRGRITAVNTDGSVSVLFIDYGNSTVVPINEVCYLKKDFLSVPQLGIPCEFDTPTSLPGEDYEDSIAVKFIKKVPKSNKWRAEILSCGAALPAPSPFPRPHSPMITIPPLILKEAESHQVYIVHTVSPSDFWCQISAHNDSLEDLMALIADYYTDKLPPVEIEQENFCVAQFSENNSWYRAKIIEVLEEGKVCVSFVDYGNQEILPIEGIAGLDPQFASLPCQAFQCSLFEVAPNAYNEKHMESFYSLNFDDSFSVVLNKQLPEGVWFVQLTQEDGQCVNSIFSTVQPIAVDDETTPTYPTPQFELETEIDVYVTSVNRPDSFYCQPLVMATELEDMMNNIFLYMDELPKGKKNGIPIDTLNIGQSCLALYGSDNDWFRAQIEDIDLDKNQVLMFYIDYGNVSYVGPHQLAPLPRRFLSTPSQVIHCSALTSPLEEVDSDILEFFSQLVQEESQYTVRIISFTQSSQKYTVQVNSSLFNKNDDSHLKAQVLNSVGVSLNFVSTQTTESSVDELSRDHLQESSVSIDLKDSKTPTTDLEEDDASDGGSTTTGEPLIHAPCKLSLASGEVVNVYVVYVQDPSQLYVQRVDLATEFNALSQEINQYCTDFADTLVQETYRTGDFVLAFYDVDSNWYRGYVKEVLPDQLLTVQFIDYGNVETVPTNKAVMCPGNFLELPIQAIPCSLTQVPSREAWPDHYKTLIDDVVLGVELKLTVVLAGGQGMFPSVGLCYTDGSNDVSQVVLNHLQEECEQGSEEGAKVMLDSEKQQDDKDTDGANEQKPNIESDQVQEKEESIVLTENNNGVLVIDEDIVTRDDEGSIDRDVERSGDGTSDKEVASLENGLIKEEGESAIMLGEEILDKENRPPEEGNQGIIDINGGESTGDSVEVKEQSPRGISNSSLSISSPAPNPRQLEVGTKYDVYLINVTSPYDIVCQLYNDTNILNSIASIIEQLYCTPDQTKYQLNRPPVVGEFVCAKYNKDDHFYRAKVLDHSEENGEFTVEFIDYGNVELVALDDLRILDPKLVSYSPLALYCGLSGIPEDPNRSDHFTSTLNNEILSCMKEEELLSMEVISVTDSYSYTVALNTSTVCINDIVHEVMLKLLKEHSADTEEANDEDPTTDGPIDSDLSSPPQSTLSPPTQTTNSDDPPPINNDTFQTTNVPVESDLLTQPTDVLGNSELTFPTQNTVVPADSELALPKQNTDVPADSELALPKQNTDVPADSDLLTQTTDVPVDNDSPPPTHVPTDDCSSPPPSVDIPAVSDNLSPAQPTSDPSLQSTDIPVNSDPVEDDGIAAIDYYPEYWFGVDDLVTVNVVSCSDLTCINCQVLDSDRSSAITEAITKVQPVSLPSLDKDSLSVGIPVLVTPTCDAWYRAVVLSLDNNDVLVQMVDTGLEASVPLLSVRLVPESLVMVSPPLSFICQLPHYLETDLHPQHGFQDSDVWELEWPDKALEYFNEAVHGKTLTAKIVTLKDKEDNQNHVITANFCYNEDGHDVDVREAIVTKLRQVKPVLMMDDDELTVSDEITRDEIQQLDGAEP